MRSQQLPQAESQRGRRSLRRPGPRCSGCWTFRPGALFAVLPALCAVAFLAAGAQNSGAQSNSAQTNQAQNNPATSPSTPPVHKHVHPKKKPTAATPAPQPVAPPAPVLPPPPDWPTNDPPAAANVVYDSRGLLIVASNSSLAQILKDISTDTGAKVEGLGTDPHMTDQRIFGTYGPGPARDVLTQLLDGSGFNILLVGDRGQGTPRRIVLSAQGGSAAQTTANNAPAPPSNDDTDAEQPAPEPEVEQPPPPPPSPAAPPVPIRTPQQIMQEIQQRQQQQQQNGQQNPQQN
jgi:hypothetical protein